MAEDIQGLLDRIQNEGLKKAEAERSEIIASAEKKASEIIAAAKAEADAMTKKAEADAKLSSERASAAIKQAARDVVIALKGDMLSRLKGIVKNCSGEAMTPEYMAKLISLLASTYAGGKEGKIEAIIPAKDADDAAKRLLAALPDDLKKRVTLSIGKDFSGGLKVGFENGDVFLDFSDEALSDVICEFVGPKLGAVIKG